MEFKLYSTLVSRVTCFKIQSLLLDNDNSFYNILIWNCLYSVRLYICLVLCTSWRELDSLVRSMFKFDELNRGKPSLI